MKTSPKPKPMPVKPENIPSELKDLNQWVCWRWEWSESKEKWDKPPYQPNGDYAKSNSPETWSSFQDSLAAHQSGKFDGIGIVLNSNNYIGVDLDHCVKNGSIGGWKSRHKQWHPLAPLPITVVVNADSYSEITPSGTGARIIFRGGELPPEGRKRGDFEIYDQGRYLTITGHRLGDCDHIRKISTEEIKRLHSFFWPPKKKRNRKSTNKKSSNNYVPSIDDVLKKAFSAKNGDEVRSLFENPQEGDQSAIDQSLCNKLAFWCTGDPDILDSLFRQSVRYREKWDEKHYSDGSTYGEETVKKAIEGCREFYKWKKPWKKKKSESSNSLFEIANAEYEGDDKLIPSRMGYILSELRKHSNDFPRVANGAMFVQTDDQIDWLENQADYFGWLHTLAPVRWHKGASMVTKGELFSEHRRRAPRYEVIEHFPHEPLLEGHYYACGKIEPGDGNHLSEFLSMFSPETEIDRDLLKACLMSMAWGAPGGTRPIFVLTASGRGAGKSKVAEIVADVFGGCISFATSEKAENIKARLLSIEGLNKRVALLDNVKSRKFSWGDLEAIVTARDISGKRMYVGEATRPNTLLWMMTLNGLSFSKDFAQRSIIVRLKKPTYSGSWEREVLNYTARHRMEIVADVVGALREERSPIARYSRWATWENEILQRLPEPDEAQAVIMERRAEADTDEEEAAVVRETFTRQLEMMHYDTHLDRVFIPSRVAATWYSIATGNRVSVSDATTILKQLIEEGDFAALRKNRTHSWGKGFVYEGAGFDPNSSVRLDIEERIKHREGIY